jgi:uncharacterized protein (TIGR00251 family)
MSRAWCTATPEGVRLFVHVTPNARKTEVLEVMDDALKIRLQAPPVDGKANEALLRFIAETLKVPKRMVRLTHGASARRKTIEVSGELTIAAVTHALLP